MYLLFDVGATKMRLGISGDGETVGKTSIVPSSKHFEDAMRVFHKEFNRLAPGARIKKSAGGIRGVLTRNKDKLAKDTLLPDWVGKPLRERISKITNSEVYLENDTAMCGLGEAVYGSGRGFDIIAYITISSGVGGVRIVNKKIDESAFGFEPGHQIIDADGSLIKNGQKEFLELEDCISGKALQERFKRDPKDIRGSHIWREIEKLLAVGITNTILHWSPEIVVIGGGVAQDAKMSLPRLKSHLRGFLSIFPKLPDIKKGELKDLAGLYGALNYLRRD